MNRCDELDKVIPIYRQGLNGPITCTSNVIKKRQGSGYKSSQSHLYAYPRKNNGQISKGE